MKIVKSFKYHDDWNDHNAVIQLVKSKPYSYSKADYMQAYRLILFEPGSNDFVYHVSVYESLKEAIDSLYRNYGGDTWIEQEIDDFNLTFFNDQLWR